MLDSSCDVMTSVQKFKVNLVEEDISCSRPIGRQIGAVLNGRLIKALQVLLVLHLYSLHSHARKPIVV